MKDKVLTWLFPVTCIFCGKVNKHYICNICEKTVMRVREPVCKKCGKPIRYTETEYCYDCNTKEFAYDQGRSLWIHRAPVSGSIYQFKYKNKRIFGQWYGKELAKNYQMLIMNWNIETIIPVPLHKKRRRKRGYNQAEVLARFLGEYTGILVETDVVKRIKDTKTQKILDNKERRANLRNAFAISLEWTPKTNVLVIDDIYTTGSTIHEVARLLKKRGVAKVFFLTISVGQGF